MSKKRADENDAHIGARIRLRRVMLNMSQEALGSEVGVTFQQIQKYEKGINRIGAGKLLTVAKVLNVPVTYFFEGAPGVEELPALVSGAEQLSEFMTNKEAIRLNMAFSRIQDSRVRANLVQLADTIAGGPI